MTCINAVYSMETLNSNVYYQLVFTHCLYFKLFLLVVSVRIFSNPFCILCLDKEHPVGLEKLPMSLELRISSSPFFKFPLLHPCVCGGYSRGPPFSYPGWCIQLSAEGWNTCGAVEAWLYFPSLKVGQIYLYSSFSTIYGGVDYKSLGLYTQRGVRLFLS